MLGEAEQKSRAQKITEARRVAYPPLAERTFYNSNGRSGCSQTLSDLSKAAIKKDDLLNLRNKNKPIDIWKIKLRFQRMICRNQTNLFIL